LAAKPIGQNLFSSKTFRTQPAWQQNLLGKTYLVAKPIEQNLFSSKTY